MPDNKSGSKEGIYILTFAHGTSAREHIIAKHMKNENLRGILERQLKWEDIDTAYIEDMILFARAEDLEGLGLKDLPKRGGDVSTMTLNASLKGKALLRARKDMRVCGVPLAELVLKVYAEQGGDELCSFKPMCKDGDFLKAGESIAEICGPARVMLQAERIMLNFLQHLSGVATETAKYADAIKGTNTRLLDTRKTTPLFRVLEKYAVACGGGTNHRMGLFDRVMLKDNHLAASNSADAGTLANAVRRAKEMNPDLPVEVEVDRISQIAPALEAQADVIMFDNFSLDDTRKAVEIVNGEAWTECSGGITLNNIASIAALGPDFVSTGALVHSASWIDIGLDWE